MKRILFICEGASSEPKFINQLKKHFLQKELPNCEVFSYCQNIYNLYDDLKKDGYLDVVDVLREKAKQRNDMERYNRLNTGFSEIYLFFDFEPQEPKFNLNKISEMQMFFNDETEHGKLYINYPMFESLYHFETLPDDNYVNYQIEPNICKDNGYKNLIASKIEKNKLDLNKMSYHDYATIAISNIKKYSKIINNNIENYEDYKDKFSLDKLLRYQIKNYNTKNKIYVINTSVLWPIDYFKKDIAKKIYRSFM